MMEKLCGPIPLEMARDAKNDAKDCFDWEGILDWPALSGGSLTQHRDKKAEKEVDNTRSLMDRLSSTKETELREMLDKLLVLNPNHRVGAAETLEARYFDP
mmetsp:Transcript_93267/g.136243  ORF Transcript_93267/g.136243 Transcript_93267/m.136243 type:complete len:101 (-) Transcript_93267:93-395(-)